MDLLSQKLKTNKGTAGTTFLGIADNKVFGIIFLYLLAK